MNFKKICDFLIRKETATLWHPESPGIKIRVERSWIGRIFKPAAFATLGECSRKGIVWRKEK